MYYVKIIIPGSGLTNQVISLISGIIIAHTNKHKVVVIDHFSNDVFNPNYTPISQIFNIEKINKFLKEKYDIIIVDKYRANFELQSIKYGTTNTKIDITNEILPNSVCINSLFINKFTNFNSIKGDPCSNYPKNIFLYYKINGYDIEEIFDETLKEHIYIDILNATYINNFATFFFFKTQIFNNILVNLEYNTHFIEKSQIVLDKMGLNDDNTNKINVIHLRLEDDAIRHWSRQNNMTEEVFKSYIENKYIDLISRFINKNDSTFILSYSLSNVVIDFMVKNNYNVILSEKQFDGRELNAIVDLLVSKSCNNVFIGAYNFENETGSTFSKYIGTMLPVNVKKVCVDLERITAPETEC
jgi:hypothetical protein